jgi:hypothetical protein
MSFDETLTRFVDNLVGRLHGPMLFRLIIQPLTAVIFAIRDGRKDGREGRVPYFWSLFTERGRRLDLLRHGWKSVGKVFVMAVVIDAVYQFITVRWFYPGEAVVVAFVLAIVPYLMLRGLANRLTARKAKTGERRDSEASAR